MNNKKLPLGNLRSAKGITVKLLIICAAITLSACGGQQNTTSSESSTPPPSSSSQWSEQSSSTNPPPQSSSAPSLSLPPIQSGCQGYATRFWDCCKPHCGWSGNMPMGVEPNNSCGRANDPLSDRDAGSACSGGNAHTCHGLIPFAMSDQVSYGWAATQSGDICGRCYQLDFSGESYNSQGDPGSKALGKRQMIVQALNIGGDVSHGQFDILIPGGGVGLFNACSSQWGVSNNELGAQYGGFLSACKQQLGYDKSLNEYKSCVRNRCDSVFKSRGLTDLYQGCMWYVDWFQVADNPSLKYKEVACPQEIIDRSGMDRRFLNDISRQCGN